MRIDGSGDARAIDVHSCLDPSSGVDPGAIAMIDIDCSWSYEDAAGRAEAVAGTLWTHGVAPDDTVAVVTHRDGPSIAALLGVSLSGAAFLAVDAVLPPARQAELIAGAGARIVLAADGWSAPGVTATVLTLPGPPVPDADPGAASARPPAGDGGGDGIAYLVFTSGSTGEPKGVAVRRRGLRTVIAAQRELLDLGPGARVYQMATVSFDAFVFELAMAFGSGATLVLPGPRAGYPGPAAVERMRETGVTHLVATPTALHAMDPSDLPDLAMVCSVGERCTGAVRDAWQPGRRLLNLYGPAEATIWATWSPVRADDDPAVIGRPIPGVTALVLDGDRAPVPAGGTGELCIAGPTVAAGYRGRPDLTALRFATVPGGDVPMYATGDTVELRADGTLRFVGRTDHQVKIQGARVEPAEVEHALRGVPGVALAAVVPYPGAGGALALGAAYTGEAEPGAVAAALRGRLPHWLVPSRLVRLDALPVAGTGKVDVPALAGRLAAGGPGFESRPVDELTPLAELVLGHARDLLGVPGLGLRDGFAEAGGNSMQALELANRVGDALRTVLDLTDLFAADSIGEWADSVEARLADPDGDHRPALPPPPEPPYASVGQVEIVVAEAYLAHSAAYVMPWCEHVTGDFDADRLAAALREAAQDHEALRTRYRVSAGGVSVTVDEVTAIGDQRCAAPTLEAGIALVEAAAAVPFRLDTDQPVRLHVVRVDGGGHLVTVMVHHAACDAVGFGQLVDLAWRRYREGRAPDGPSAPAYRQFAAWQRAYLAGPAAPARRWWRGALTGARPLRLPGAEGRDPVRPRTGRRRPFALDPGAAEGVARLCRDLRTSPFAVFCAAYTVALEPYLTGGDVIGTPVSARGLPAFDGTIGFFITTLPLRLRPPDTGSVADWLGAWTADCLDTIAHRDLPLPEIVREWPGGGPPSVLFAVNYAQPAVDAGRRRIVLDPGPVKFDLILSLFGGAAGWSGELVHDATAMPPDEAEDLLDRFTTAVTAIVADPHAPAASLVGGVLSTVPPIPDFDLDHG